MGKLAPVLYRGLKPPHAGLHGRVLGLVEGDTRNPVVAQPAQMLAHQATFQTMTTQVLQLAADLEPGVSLHAAFDLGEMELADAAMAKLDEFDPLPPQVADLKQALAELRDRQAAGAGS